MANVANYRSGVSLRFKPPTITALRGGGLKPNFSGVTGNPVLFLSTFFYLVSSNHDTPGHLPFSTRSFPGSE